MAITTLPLATSNAAIYRVRLWPIRIYLNPAAKYFARFSILIRLYIKVLNLDSKEYKL